MTAFARRAADGGYWVVAIALLGAYCGLLYGERERRAAIESFFQPHPTVVELTVVEPADRAPDALVRPQP